MTSDLRNLYLYHIFNGIAISAVGNFLFLDSLFLRFGPDLKQFGVIEERRKDVMT